MEIIVNSCVPVDLVLLAVILVMDVFVVVPGREITVTWMLTSVLLHLIYPGEVNNNFLPVQGTLLSVDTFWYPDLQLHS
jgi:hypothetical protein